MQLHADATAANKAAAKEQEKKKQQKSKLDTRKIATAVSSLQSAEAGGSKDPILEGAFPQSLAEECVCHTLNNSGKAAVCKPLLLLVSDAASLTSHALHNENWMFRTFGRRSVSYCDIRWWSWFEALSFVYSEWSGYLTRTAPRLPLLPATSRAWLRSVWLSRSNRDEPARY
jgi:hypothetical protein